MSEEKTTEKTTRREVLKKAVYITPVILTLAANPSLAQSGSGVSPGGMMSMMGM